MSPLALLVIVAVVLVAALAAGWVIASRVKQSVEATPTAVLQGFIKVTPACVERLQSLSQQPVLLKLSDGVLRYQVDNRPMAPAVVAPGGAAKALREAGAALSAQYGGSWVALLRPASADTLSVDRLS